MSNILHLHKAHLARDARFTVTGNGNKVCNFTVAVNDGFGDKQQSIWIDCALWGDRAEKATELLTKGKPVGIVARLRPARVFDGNNGPSPVICADVIEYTLLSKREDSQYSNNQHQDRRTTAEPSDDLDGMDDDIPF